MPLLLAGMRIVPIGVDKEGNINMVELKQKAEEHKDKSVSVLLHAVAEVHSGTKQFSSSAI